MITVVLCDRTANGVKIPNKRTAYKCPNGLEASKVLEQVVLCGARNGVEFEAMREHLYDTKIGGRTLLENPFIKVMKDGVLTDKRVPLGHQFAT